MSWMLCDQEMKHTALGFARRTRKALFLDFCIPHVTERDRSLILQKNKELLNQTNLHYLVSDRFRETVTSISNSVQEKKSTSNVYMRIKELADKLRSHREKKNPALPQGGATCQHKLQRWQPIATRVQEGPHIDMSLFMVVVDRGHPPDVCSVLPLAGAEEELR
ncbi:hypothetical protein MRX96_040686 [Rhipicephalus microplus]